MTNRKHVSVIYIKSSIDKVWQALTCAEFTRRYFHATNVESEWTRGAKVTFYNQDGSVAVEGKVLEVDEPEKLSFTWHVHYNPSAKLEDPSRVTFALEVVEDSIKVTVIHDQFPENSVVFDEVDSGWVAIMCNLKTLLETDSVMSIS